MSANFLSDLKNDDFELFVQNILPGPLLISDMDDLTLQPFEPVDLSWHDQKKLKASMGLRAAVRKRFLRIIDADEYEEQREIFEERAANEYDDHMLELEESTIALDVDEIDLASGKSSYKKAGEDRRAESRRRRREAMNDPEYYAKKYAEASERHGIDDPEMFKEMVDNQEITVDHRGRKVKSVDEYDPEEYARSNNDQAPVLTRDSIPDEPAPRRRRQATTVEPDGDMDEVESIDLGRE